MLWVELWFCFDNKFEENESENDIEWLIVGNPMLLTNNLHSSYPKLICVCQVKVKIYRY